jgi:putative heme iron utilization protein
MSVSELTDHLYPPGVDPSVAVELGVDPAHERPSPAEQSRTLLEVESCGSLATLAASGHPFGSIVTYAVDDDGSVILLISALAEHTANARRDPRASLLVTEAIAPGDDPLAAARVTVVGSLVRYRPHDGTRHRDRYLARHLLAAFYGEFGDFEWWRLAPTSVRWVGGFGRMTWLAADAVAAAEPDPLTAHADGICAHMNADHADANLAYVQAFGGLTTATSAQLVGVDRYGMHLLAVTPDGERACRVAFPHDCTNASAVRETVVAMLADARRMLAR